MTTIQHDKPAVSDITEVLMLPGPSPIQQDEEGNIVERRKPSQDISRVPGDSMVQAAFERMRRASSTETGN